MNFCALPDYVPKFTQTDPTGIETDYAGAVSDLTPDQPKFKANIIATDELRAGSITLNGPYLGRAKLLGAPRSGIDVDHSSVRDYVTSI